MQMFKLMPHITDNIWGGTRLIDEYGFKTDKKIAGEAWVLSCHKDGASVAVTGENKGKTLEEIYQSDKSICGKNADGAEFFPILIKFIDAKNNLSVQVHPDDEYAMRVEGEYGKTEAWYILDCDDDAELIFGFNRNITKEELREASKSEKMLELVNKVKVKKGDIFFIESGTMHAICKGILLAEVQQNSNTTYRIYDYGRLGADGKPRELHIDKACDVTKLCPPEIADASSRKTEKTDGAVRSVLQECDIFKMFDLKVDSSYTAIADETSFVSLLCLDGEAEVKNQDTVLSLKKGDSLFIPASNGEFTVTGKADFLETRI